MAITWWGEQVWKEMEEVVKRGVNTFKHFMAYKGSLMVNDDEMYQSFLRCAELGALPLVHAENGDVVARLQQKYMSAGTTGPEGHAYSRPPEVEGEATNRAIMIADAAGVPLYVVHVSSEDAHEAIRRARMLGRRVYGEPLDPAPDARRERVLQPGLGLCRPPGDVAALPRQEEPGFAVGRPRRPARCRWSPPTTAPSPPSRSAWGVGDFTKIPNGTGGLEDRMPILWTRGVATGRLTMNEFVAVTSTNIAKILNVYPRKGAIARRRRCRYRRLGPGEVEDHHRRQPGLGHRLQRLRGLRGHRPAALHPVARRCRVHRRQARCRGRPRPLRRPSAQCPGQQALSSWKALTTPQPVERSAKNMPAGV